MNKFDLKAAEWDNNPIVWEHAEAIVLHHITDIENIITRFYNLLNPGGFLSIADLYIEDGSFHGEGFTGHKGFDPAELSSLLLKSGFEDVSHRQCFVINKKISDTETKQFNVFLIIAHRPQITF